MKKLLLLLLLPIFVQAQTNVTVRRNATTKMVTTYLNPNTMDTLVAYSGGLTDDYILQWDNSIKRAVWINPTSIIPVITTTTISPTATTNGISVSGSQIRLHAVTPTTGGVLTNGIDSIGGEVVKEGTKGALGSLGGIIGGVGIALGAVSILSGLFKKKQPAPQPAYSTSTASTSSASSVDFGGGRVVFEISGPNLVGVLNRAGAKLQRFGP